MLLSVAFVFAYLNLSIAAIIPSSTSGSPTPKSLLLYGIKNGYNRRVEKLVCDNPVLLKSFDCECFDELLNYFKDNYHISRNNQIIFWKLFAILKSTFLCVRPNQKQSPLIRSIQFGNDSISYAILNVEGISKIANYVDEFGRTALMYACILGSIDMTIELACLDHRSINISDNDGMTALDFACYVEGDQVDPEILHNKFRIAEILVSQGAKALKTDPECLLPSGHETLSALIQRIKDEHNSVAVTISDTLDDSSYLFIEGDAGHSESDQQNTETKGNDSSAEAPEVPGNTSNYVVKSIGSMFLGFFVKQMFSEDAAQP